MEITVTIKAPDLAAAIQSLADAIVAAGCMPEDSPAPVKAIKITPEVVKALELDEAPVSTAEKNTEEPAPVTYTLEQVRAAFVEKNTTTNRDKLKNLLSDFNVKKVTDLQEKDFAAVMARLEEL